MPVPILEGSQCEYGCCERTFCPLQLSFAKTIDTFQGLNAGPVDEGKPPNVIQRIICDPGNRQFEAAHKPGLFYTIISRATTAGDKSEDGKRHNSAVYFYDFGLGRARFHYRRIANLNKSYETGKPYSRVEDRNRWVRHLKDNVHKSEMSKDEIEEVMSWARSHTTMEDV